MNEINQEPVLDNSDEISLREFILKILGWCRYFLSKWKIIMLVGFIGGLIGLYRAWSSTLVYKAELSFVLQNEKAGAGLGSAMGLASQLGIDIGAGSSSGQFSGDNFLELMKSRNVIEKALLTEITYKGKKETLVEFYIDINKIRQGWKDKPELKNIYFPIGADRSKFTLKQDSILGSFHKSIVESNMMVLDKVKKSSIISLSVTSPNELFSKCFTEVLAKVVSDFYVKTKIEKQAQNVAILQRQTDSVRRELYGNISGFAQNLDINPNPNPLLQTTLRVSSQRKQVDVQANTTSYIELKRNLELSKMSLLQETPLIQIIDRPILPLEKLKPSRSRSAIVGGIIGGLICVIYLGLKKSFSDLNI